MFCCAKKYAKNMQNSLDFNAKKVVKWNQGVSQNGTQKTKFEITSTHSRTTRKRSKNYRY